MSKGLKTKIAILVVLTLLSLGVMVGVLCANQPKLALETYTQEMQDEMAKLPSLLEEAAQESTDEAESYDAIYQSKADSIAFMAKNNAGYAATDAKMDEYKELLNVDNVMIVEKGGKIVAQAEETKADFTRERFNKLREVFSTGKASDAVEVDDSEQNWLDRYYASAVDGSHMVVIEQDPSELRTLQENSGSTASVLKNIVIGQGGYIMAVSAKDYTIAYHPTDSLVGADSLDAGLKVEDLEDGNVTWMELNGQKIYAQVALIGDMYYIAVVPNSVISWGTSLTVGVIAFVFLAVMLVVDVYAVFTLRDDERRLRRKTHEHVSGAGKGAEHEFDANRLGFNPHVAKKAAIMTFIGFLAILGVTFYMQTLFSLSNQSITNKQGAAEVEETLATANTRMEELKAQYDERYLSKCKVAGYILDENPNLRTRDSLQELASTLQVQYLFTFDSNGDLQATNAPFSNYSLSTDPSQSSYEFRKLLQGADHVVQDAHADEISGELRQYIGVPLYDSNSEVDGLVQLGIRPSRLADLLQNVQIDHVLDSVQIGNGGFAFAVSKEDSTIAYYPDEKLEGKSATDIGITAEQLKAGFNDYLTIDGEKYYASSIETDDYYVYVASTEGELMAQRGPLTLIVAIIAFICQLLIFLLVSLTRKDKFMEEAIAARDSDDSDRVFDVKLSDGTTVRNESAVSRWFGTTLGWHELTPEQKTATVMRAMLGVVVVVIFIAVMFRDQIFDQNSVFNYILGGSWERGLNIFAITAAVMFICVAITLVTVAKKLLHLAAGILGSRGATVCRLLASFIKYATIIGMVYYTLLLMNVDGTALLASAGILSIAVSLGAKELVSDILSGLFIIFEGEFRVGDAIEVGSNSGTVLEIGVRTTKIDDGNGNVLVMRNSNISNVLNKTKRDSFATCDMSIEYDESLERVENVLEKELPNIKRRLPAIIDGPFYKGVVALADNSVNIRIVARCAESDRGQLTRDLNREMKLIFDHYNISIPFPQIVVRDPVVREEVSYAEKLRADKFNAEQQAAAKDLGNTPQS